MPTNSARRIDEILLMCGLPHLLQQPMPLNIILGGRLFAYQATGFQLVNSTPKVKPSTANIETLASRIE
jgi:hypothetical protein